MIKKLAPVVFGAALLFSLVLSIGLARPAHAANLASFDPGRIIDDSVFFNANAMTTLDIQNFLNNKTPNCDTSGSQPYSGSQTRAQYAATKGYKAPFTCLKDYSTATIAKSADGYCNGYAAGQQTAAQILSGVAQSCGINPAVLIVLLQKEQGLVTDNWPWPSQYKIAAGYACPDTAPCDAAYYGFFNQVYNAARQYKRYSATPNLFSYRAFRNNTIQWNPTASCGTSTVYIQNQATAGLYNYTPYRPNQAALNAGYGTGDSCSAYGNRNFWLYFTDWFGTTRQILPGCNTTTNNTSCVWRLTTTQGYQFLTDSIEERNSLVANGATYSGLAFYARANWAPNSLATYRILLPNGERLWTANIAERNALVAGGSTDEGIQWYSDAPDANTAYPVFRLSSSTGHILTASISEKDQLMRLGYSYEGIAFGYPSPLQEVYAPPAGKTLVYRMISATGVHFWTSNLYERDAILNQGFRYEGVGMVLPTDGSTNTMQVYRLYSPYTLEHFWTSSTAERDYLVKIGYGYEGVAWSAAASQANPPVYRMYAPSSRMHFWTSAASERDGLVRAGYVYEGIGWNQAQ